MDAGQQDTPDGSDCKSRCRKAFFAGRRAGLWLAFNGPRAQQANRRRDMGMMRQQDRNLEGLGDVFGRAEDEARLQRLREKLARRRAIPRPMVQEDENFPYPDDGKYDEAPGPIPPMGPFGRSDEEQEKKQMYEAVRSSISITDNQLRRLNDELTPPQFQRAMRLIVKVKGRLTESGMDSMMSYVKEKDVSPLSSSSSSSSTPSSSSVFSPPPAPSVAPAPKQVFLNSSNAGQFIGKQVFFTAQGGRQTATITSVAPSGINISGASPAVASSTKNNLTFSRKMWVMS